MAFPASAYATLSPDTLPKKTVASSRTAANADREAELERKHLIERANRVLDALDARSQRLAAQIKRLQKMKAACDARYEAIEDRAIAEMQAAGLDKAPGIRVNFSLRPAAPALQVDNEALIPAEFIDEKLVTSVNKVAVKLALAKNIDVPGCHLTQKISLIRK